MRVTREVDILHHVGLVTSDLEASVASYERLGFLLTPLSVPRIPLTPGGEPQSLGVGNRTAIFRENYLELLGVIDPERWAAVAKDRLGPYNIDAPLRRYEGLHVLHLGTDDLDAVHARYQRQGIPSSAPRPFERQVDTPDGTRLMRARSLAFPDGANPEALVQVAQHLTPELVLQPRFMRHPNGAIALTEVIVCTTEPEEVAARYGRYAGAHAERVGSGLVLNLGRSRITLADLVALGEIVPGVVPPVLPFLAGFTVAGDLHRARQVLRENGVHYQEHEHRLIVPPQEASGCAVLFEPEYATRP
jgi:catechol 2,3-dioxygenase-like lactoylglutathione lyase family enzyme